MLKFLIKIFFVTITIELLLQVNFIHAEEVDLKNTNWYSSCRPCGDTLNECSTCLKDECVQCVLEIPYSGCLNCMNDLINLPYNFYCDNELPYHQSVCKIHCRMNNGGNLVLNRDGYCDKNSGNCVCTNDLLTTTAHPLFNRTTISACEYKIRFDNPSTVQVIQENLTAFRFKVMLESNRPNLCVFNDRVKVKVNTKQYSAKDGNDFLGFSAELEFNKTKLWHEIKIDINDDRIIEPYEFFAIEIGSVTPSILSVSTPRKIVYIEDNDYKSSNGIADSDIINVFEYEEASSFIYIIYKNKFNENIFVPDPNSIYPDYGGLTTSEDRLKILMQINGAFTINVHTIEVNNPDKCNLNSFNFRRLDFNLNPYEEYMNSFVLNNRPIIDVNYYKAFQNLGDDGDEPYYLEINFLNTKDDRGVTKCELRAFAEEIY